MKGVSWTLPSSLMCQQRKSSSDLNVFMPRRKHRYFPREYKDRDRVINFASTTPQCRFLLPTRRRSKHREGRGISSASGFSVIYQVAQLFHSQKQSRSFSYSSLLLNLPGWTDGRNKIGYSVHPINHPCSTNQCEGAELNSYLFVSVVH